MKVIRTTATLTVLAAAVLSCAPGGDRDEGLPLPYRSVDDERHGTCGGDAWAAMQTSPFLVPGQPSVGEKCLEALPPKSGEVEVQFDLSASGTIRAVRLPRALSQSATACLQEWGSGLFFLPARTCDGTPIPSTTSLSIGSSFVTSVVS